MNNSIKEDYCSFEVSKLLKEKGFKVATSRYYMPDGKIVVNFEESESEREYKFDADDFYDNWNDGRLVDKNNGSCWGCNTNNGYYFSPVSLTTHSIAIKWVRENFGIEVESVCIRFNSPKKKGYQSIIISNDYQSFEQIGDFSKPEEAIEAALLYTLQNLIK